MAAERLSMRKIKEVLRLRAQGLSNRAIARSLKIPRTTVRRYSTRAEEAGLSWPLPEGLTESALEEHLFPPAPPIGRHERAEPDWAYMHRELRRPGVTRQLLWLEYKEAHPDGFQYARFCGLFREWKGALDPVLRQEHQFGEKLFVDYAGQTMPVVDSETGEVREAEIFVGTLGASNFTLRCYHPLVARLAGGDFLGGRVREGQAHTAYRGQAFIIPILKEVPRYYLKVWLRIDAGFPKPHLLRSLEARGIRYVAWLRGNRALNRLAEPYLKRPPGRPPREGRTWVHELTYKAGT